MFLQASEASQWLTGRHRMRPVHVPHLPHDARWGRDACTGLIHDALVPAYNVSEH